MELALIRRAHPLLRAAVVLALLVGLLLMANLSSEWVQDRLSIKLTPATEPVVHRTIMIAMVAYVFFMALPFVPGVEIGLTLIAMFGAEIVPLVYGGTVLALLIAFLVGRLVPQLVVIRLLDALRLKRAAGMLQRIEAVEPDARLAFLLQNASWRGLPTILRLRHLALIVAFNLPGNALLGGGGGIGLAAGYSRLFGFADYALTVAVAVAPIPLMVVLFGS